MAHRIQVTKVEPFTRWMETRFPFRYGIASMTRLPHLFLRITIAVDGKETAGICSEGLPPKWFTKNPKTTFEEDLPDLVGVIQHAAEICLQLGEQTSVFDLWQDLYREQEIWANANNIPPLLANLGVSLLERGVIDAFCRSLETPFAEIIRTNKLGIRLGEIHPELAEKTPNYFLPKAPLQSIAVRHTVGLGDALIDPEIPDEDRAEDSLPQALVDCIREYGLHWFKVKISGDLDVDRERLSQLAALLEKESPSYQLTLDGNEQSSDINSFENHWKSLLADKSIQPLLSDKHLLFVEQPIHRDVALSDSVKDSFAKWTERPACIIDESDSQLSSLPRALEIGYNGTSHKNCKGVIKGVANACLLAFLQKKYPDEDFVLSGEDLANVGPVALLQDLCVMATLGIEHVERNGHHYFTGLSMFPNKIQQQVVENHSDTYGMKDENFAALKISNGKLNIRSVLAAPFGTNIDPTEEVCHGLGNPGWPI